MEVTHTICAANINVLNAAWPYPQGSAGLDFGDRALFQHGRSCNQVADQAGDSASRIAVTALSMSTV